MPPQQSAAKSASLKKQGKIGRGAPRAARRAYPKGKRPHGRKAAVPCVLRRSLAGVPEREAPAAQQRNAANRKTGRADRARRFLPGRQKNGKDQPFSELGTAFFKSTSWLPPSTMLVEETTVRRAFSCSSGIVSAPQLHMVLLTLYSVVCTPSASAPA